MAIDITKELLNLQDLDYKAYSGKINPTVPQETIIGVRIPKLRQLAKMLLQDAKQLDKSEPTQVKSFFADLPHKYFEEKLLHAILLSEMKDFNELVEELERFLPYVEDWATCDTISPKIFAEHRPEAELLAYKWIKDSHPYTIRFGICVFMSYFLGDLFKTKQADAIAAIRSDEYYVNMMTAWYFATALAFNYEEVLPYLEKQHLDDWTHNKAIQKAVESRRITAEQKEYLKTLRIPVKKASGKK
ncbi:MAG: DNA alkylation repair protein [Veillonella sp.]|uniref:DNA alkylation repair protein n=1 Tax=Veillonella sp. TaxID=1926307 RepID=UPI0025D7D949|nr:DNA alkylation repair protein [Veillonella sp.]MBE6080319.1 DNA alkylation repair protein [Veillonella sp.]